MLPWTNTITKALHDRHGSPARQALSPRPLRHEKPCTVSLSPARQARSTRPSTLSASTHDREAFRGFKEAMEGLTGFGARSRLIG